MSFWRRARRPNCPSVDEGTTEADLGNVIKSTGIKVENIRNLMVKTTTKFRTCQHVNDAFGGVVETCVSNEGDHGFSRQLTTNGVRKGRKNGRRVAPAALGKG